MTGRSQEIRRLRRARPRQRFARATVGALAALVVVSWAVGPFYADGPFSERRLRNLERFVSEVRPHTEGSALTFYGDLFAERGLSAMWTTLAISVAAIVLASIAGYALAPLAARNFANPSPFLPGSAPPTWIARALWAAVVWVTRAVLIFLRAIPEYVWAFLFLAMLGPGAWPAVLALALHNAGILGRLGGEIIENAEVSAAKALRGLGATRAQIGAVALFPQTLNRFLLYFFYRWETCVREATILGLLGILSLGFWVTQARAATRYDEMVFYIALGAALVLAGDLISAAARAVVRRS